MAEVNPADDRLMRPWHVTTLEGNLAESFNDQAVAEQDCKRRNAICRDLGITEHYKVIPRP